MGTPADTIHNTSRISPYTFPLAAIYCYNGCLSGSWWYATPHLPAEAADSDAIPWQSNRMASRNFIFSNFYRAVCKHL